MNNLDIKAEASKAGVKLWMIAERLGIADGTSSKKLRKELPQEQKDKIRSIIAELKEVG